MGRPSTIDRLPSEIREAIGRLRDHGKTIDEILEHLRAMEVDVSRSALGRHIQGMEVVGERLRRSRAMGEALGRQLGDAPESQMTRLNIELLQTFIFDMMSGAEGDSESGAAMAEMLKNPKAVALIAEATERLTKASRNNAEYIATVEKRAEERTKKAAMKAVETVAKQGGLSGDTIAAIKAGIFGIGAKA